MKLSILSTVFNESAFLEYSLNSYLEYVDFVALVEGSYLETQKLGASARSDDGTIEIIEKYRNDPKVHIVYANEQTDKDQRNVGYKKIKELNPDGFLLIIDGDEVYQPQTFDLIYSTMKMMRKTDKKVAYFNSITFINDLKHYTNQFFPRLFDLKNSVEFVNDNYLSWNEPLKAEQGLYGQGFSPIKYHHFAFTKGKERFLLKKHWWETRFGKPFKYSWYVDENGKINDKTHQIFLYEGKFPDIMKSHPMMQKEK